MSDRDDRIETLYNESAWDLAEQVVDLQDKNARLVAQVVSKVKSDHQRERNRVLSEVWTALRDAGEISGMGVVNRLMES